MARLGRGQPFKPLVQRWNYFQIQGAVWSAAGSGDSAWVGSSLTTALFLRVLVLSQARNRASTY